MNMDCSYNSFEEDKDINTEIDLENGSNLQECKICYEKKPLRLLFCGHEMCLECISSIQYVNGCKTCPFCRQIYLKKLKTLPRGNNSRVVRNNYTCVLTNNDCNIITKGIVCGCVIAFMWLLLKFRIV